MRVCVLMFLVIFLTGTIFFGNYPTEAGEKADRWTPTEMIKYKRVGGTAISPDGKLIAYTVSSPVMEGEKSEFLTHIWIVSSDGTINHQFTRGEKSCANPSFSHDGVWLAFTSSRGKDDKNQVWIMRLTGGEAEQLTVAKPGVSSYKWSPDALRIAYVMNDPSSEEEEKDNKEKRDMKVQDTNYKYAHLYTITIEKDSEGERKVQRLTAGNFHITNFDWSPDGKTVAFAHQISPDVDVWPTTDISSVPSDSGSVNLLVSWKGSDSSPHYSPDGKWLAFLSDDGDPKWASQSYVFIIPTQGGEPVKLAETPDAQPFGLTWSIDSNKLFLEESDRTTRCFFALPVNGGKIIKITEGEGNYSGASFSRNVRKMAFIHQTSEEPPEVYITGTKKFNPVKLTDVNADYPKLPMGKTKVLKWTSKDGMGIEGLLTYPVNYEEGRQYPLILNIHGGPAGVYTQYFTAAGSLYPIQAFAQEGYVVLRPNPRGSSGYGKDFRFANYNDWGFGDYDDVISGADKVIEMGVAHPDSLCVMGWSYGGYMTSFIITRTDRFKAASVGAGVTNLMSFTGTSDIHSFLPDYFYSEPWDKIDAYMRHSAMFNIKGVTTPTQVLHGEKDVRVPLSQGQELYNALKRQGCDTEMIVYPRMPHGIQEPKFIVDIGERIISWFNKHLGRESQVNNDDE
ncbi:MAG TPA: S9 family peptidase [bacterium]|nr:S9 family peptidase [bacterium]